MSEAGSEHAGATERARRLRTLMRERTVGLPGAFNGLVARAVARAGFDGAYVSGAAVTASAGVPDVGIRSLNEFCEIVRQVADSSGLPVIADADTGFGEGEMVRRTLVEYHRAGAAGFHIEDQVFPKRCGHLEGKRLIAIDHFQEKVACAARARDEVTGGAFIVCARTDARSVDGLDAAIERAKAYVEAGADMIFPEGLASEEEFGRVAEALRGFGSGEGPLLLANMTEFGKTPMLPIERFAALGYHCVIWPVTTLRIAARAVEEFLASLKQHGSAEPALPRMQTREELYDLLGYTPGVEWPFPNPSSGH